MRIPSSKIVCAMLCVVCYVVFLASCSRSNPVSQGFTLASDRTSFTVGIMGRSRTGRLYVPKGYDGSRTFSLMLAFHGAGATGSSLAANGLNAIADDLDFIVAYPDGSGFRWDGPDDTPFILYLILELKKNFAIEPGRVYLTGHSAGAIQVYELAQALPGQFAAIAPVAGLMNTGSHPEGRPGLSVFHVHSLDDTEVPYAGTEEWGLLSVDDSLRFWREVNTVTADSPGIAFFEREGVTGTHWSGTRGDVSLLSFEKNGHMWPPIATDYIGDFFYNHPARPLTARVTVGSGTQHQTQAENLALSCEIKGRADVEQVSFFSGMEEIATVPVRAGGSATITAQWKSPARGVHRVRAEVSLANGEIVKSTMNAWVIVAPEAIPTSSLTAFSTSDENADLLPQYAIDGNDLTRWSSGWTDKQTLTVDLGSQEAVSGVSFAWESAYASAYLIETSLDKASWEQAYTTTEGKGGIELASFAQREARYVRFTGIKRNSPWGYSFWEMRVHH